MSNINGKFLTGTKFLNVELMSNNSVTMEPGLIEHHDNLTLYEQKLEEMLHNVIVRISSVAVSEGLDHTLIDLLGLEVVAWNLAYKVRSGVTL
jgi:hypothetical protein